MKFIGWLATLLIVCSQITIAQNSQAPQDYVASSITFPLVNPPAAVAPSSIGVTRLDNPGPCTYFYWVVARYTIGNAQPAGPATIANVACTPVNGNRVSWQNVVGAASYDVLRTSVSTPPAGACGCAVATGVTTSATDTGTLNSYTVNTFDPSTVVLSIDNEPTSAGASNLYLRSGSAKFPIGGSSGTAGGANTQIQYNNSGAFGGAPNFTYDNAAGSFTLKSLSSATALTTGVNSGQATVCGSVWNGSAPVQDCWVIYTNDFSGAFSSGSNLIFNHLFGGGSGRVLFLSDVVVGPPATADATHNFNSFAWDNQGAYYNAAAPRQMLWEMANTVSPASGFPVTFRQNYVPIFDTDGCAGCSAEIGLGGSGTLGAAGNYSGPPKWLFTGLNSSGFFPMSLTHNGTAARTKTFADATGIVPDLAGLVGQIQFNGTSDLNADSNLFWDNTNKRLGLGTNSPSVTFHTRSTGAGGFPQLLMDNGATGGTTAYSGVTDTGNGSGGGKYLIGNTTSSGAALFTLDLINNNMGVNQTAPAKTLDVNGSAKITGALGVGGTTAGALDLVGAASDSTLGSNSAGIVAPASASFTAYRLRLPSAAPAANTLPLLAAPSSSVSAITFGKVTSSYVDNSIALTGTDINTSNQVTGLNGTSLSGLATGILKNTTGTGVPSIAIGSDLPAAIPISKVGTAGLSATSPATISSAGVIANGLASVTNDAQTKAAIVPNTAPSAGQVPVGNAGNTAYAPISISQDCTLASTGVLTCTKTNNVSYAASATTDTTNGTNISSGTVAAARVAAAGATGQVQFNGGTNPAGDSNLFWDNTNKRLGVGTNGPTMAFHLRTTASGAFPQALFDNGAAGGTTAYSGVTDTGNGSGGGKYLIGNTTSSGAALFTLDLINNNMGVNQTAPGKTLDVNGTTRSVAYGTTTNCSSSASPAVCGSAAGGSVALPTGAVPTLVVNTTAVTANSQIFLQVDEGLGTKLSVTCNTTLATLLTPVVTARSAGTSFTFTINATIATNPACVSYHILN